MADTKTTALTALTPILTDLLYAVDDPGGTPISKKLTIQNLFTLLGPLKFAWVLKASDESVTSSVTLQDDDELMWAVGANEVWDFEFILFLSSTSSTPDFQCSLTIPSGTFNAGTITLAASASTNSGDVLTGARAGATSGLDYTGQGVIANLTTMATFKGSVSVGVTGGTAKLQWAQNVSNGTAVTVEGGSYLVARRWA